MLYLHELIGEMACQIGAVGGVLIDRESDVSFPVEDEIRDCRRDEHISANVKFPTLEQQWVLDVTLMETKRWGLLVC